MKMVTLRDPESGAMVCVRRGNIATLDADALETLGYPGWEVIAELDAMPTDELTPEQEEEARLNGLTRAEFLGEIDAKVNAKVASMAASIAQPGS